MTHTSSPSPQSLEEQRKKMKKLLDENPILKQAVKEALQDMKKPENIKKMSEDFSKILKIYNYIQILQNERKKGE